MRGPDTSKRALVYTRSATRSQTESGNEQLRACEACAGQHGLTVVGRYHDYGSGLRIGEELRRLFADLMGGDVEAVLVRDLSRISRDAVKLNAFLRFAGDIGVAVVVADGGCPSAMASTEVRVRMEAVRVAIRDRSDHDNGS